MLAWCLLRVKAVLVDRVDPVQHDRSELSNVEPRSLVCAVEHDFQEVATVVFKVSNLDELHEERRVSSLQSELAVTESEDCLQARGDVTHLGVEVVVGEHVKHRFGSNLEGGALQSVELLPVVRRELVQACAVRVGNVLDGQLQEVEEGLVVDVPINEEVVVVR